MAWEKPPTERSYRCNGNLLSQRRRQRGWTQEELAARANFSVRLVAKAEAGENLQPDTVDVLASTLSTAGNPLFPEDLVTHPKELALEFVELLKTHQGEVVSKCRHFLSDDILFVIPGDPEIFPFAGRYVGIEEFDRGCRLFFETIEIVDLDCWKVEFAMSDGTDVVVTYTVAGQLHGLAERGINTAIPMLVINVMKFRRGRIVELHDYYQVPHAEKEAVAQKELLNKLGDGNAEI